MVTAETVKNKMRGLIQQANQTTGKTDTDMTAAIGSLIAGFGQGGGGGGGLYETGELIGDGIAHLQGSPILIPVSFEPDVLYICLTNTDETFDMNHVVGVGIVRDAMFLGTVRQANATNIGQGGFGVAIDGLYGSPTINASYNDGVVSFVASPSGRGLANGASYTWFARKW